MTEICKEVQLDEFIQVYRLPEPIQARTSNLFWRDAYRFYMLSGSTAALQTIKYLERGERAGIKKASKFTRHPLRGLWKQHFYCAQFYRYNIANELTEEYFDKMVKDVAQEHNSDCMTPAIASALACRIALEPITQRSLRGALTGEWIVFGKRNGKNYYLSLAEHKNDDHLTFSRLIESCTDFFPELKSF